MRTVLQPRGPSAVVVAWLAAFLPAGCAPSPPPATGAAAEVTRAAQAEPYPDLADVPPRPRLGYTLRQKRAIAEVLVADRDHARYEGETLRHRLLGTAPPPPAIPPAVAPTAAPPEPTGPAARPAPTTEIAGDTARSETDTGDLDDFLDWLFGGEAPRQGSGPPAGAAEDDAAAADAGPGPSARPLAAAPRTPPPAAADAGPDAKPSSIAPPAPVAEAAPRLVEFELRGEEVPASDMERLGALARAGRAGGVLVVAEGDDPVTSLRRARDVARLLVRMGVDPDRVQLRQAGPGDRVRVERLGGGTISGEITASPAGVEDE